MVMLQGRIFIIEKICRQSNCIFYCSGVYQRKRNIKLLKAWCMANVNVITIQWVITVSFVWTSTMMFHGVLPLGNSKMNAKDATAMNILTSVILTLECLL